MKKFYLVLLALSALTILNAQFRTYPPQVWNTLDKVVGNAKVVSFGESSHRLVELHKFANDMFKYLVEKKGFRVFVFETMWELENVVNTYIASDSAELDFKQQFYLNAFNSVYTRDMLKWVKEWNKSKPNDKIIISGYQPEQPVSDAREINHLLGNAGIQIPDSTQNILNTFSFYNGTFKHDLDAVSYFGKRRRAKIPLFRKTERDSLYKAINGLTNFTNTEKSALSTKLGAKNYQELLAHILSIKAYYFGIAYFADPTNFPAGCGFEAKNNEAMVRNLYSEGDNIRAEIFNTLRETRYGNKKIFIWMHAWHAAKYAPLLGEVDYYELPVRGTVSWGTYMHPILGKDYKVVGSVVPCDDCNYTVPSQEVDMSKQFYHELKEQTVLIDLKNPGPKFSKLPLNKNGSLFVQEGACFLKNLNLTTQFDAVFYLPRSKDVR